MSGSAARIAESLDTARIYLETRDWAETRRCVVEENVYQLNTDSSRKRIASELIKRLRTLTDKEVEFFVSSYGDDRKAMLWIAICRTYPFVRELSTRVIADRWERTVSDYTLGAYEAFFEEEAGIHSELSDMTEAGKKKMRNQITRMLVECGLITEEGEITPLRIGPMLRSALDEDHLDDLECFPGRRF